jgi:hypothetical protein
VVDLPRVSYWADQGTGWRVAGVLPVYSSLEFEPRFNDTGPWQITVPWDDKAKALSTEHIVTVDWRGRRVFTGVVVSKEKTTDDGQKMLSLSGLDALAYIGYSIAWPQPSSGIAQQVLWDPNAAPPIRTAADAAVLQVIRDNLLTRRSQNVNVVGNQGIGPVLSVRPAFDNLLELALRKANRGGFGIRVVMSSGAVALNDVDSTTALLTVDVYQPADKSVRILFDDSDGSAADWTLTRTAPTASNVVVSGVRGKYRRVGRNATGWNPTREQFVQGPASYDDTELDQAADEALDAGEPTVNAKITAAETGRQQAFRDFNVGDTATAKLGGDTVVDVITAISVKVDSDGPVVSPIFGDPDGIDPRDTQAKLLRRARRDIDLQKYRTRQGDIPTA